MPGMGVSPSRCQFRLWSWFHSRSWANSPPMKSSFLPDGPHEAEIGAQVGELLPAVAGHLGQQRALAVHDLVVRQRQHEVLAERVDGCRNRARRGGGGGAPGRAACRRACRASSHVPFHRKPRPPAKVGRETPPVGRLLGDHHRAGALAADDGVETTLEEPDRLEVLACRRALGTHSPWALAAVVEVQHRGRPRRRAGRRRGSVEPAQRVADEGSLRTSVRP